MPSRDKLHRIQTVRMSRRDVLHLAALAGTGLTGLLLFGCGDEEKEEKRTPTPLPATVAPSGFFDSDGVKIHYETFGQGKPIVLVHGFAGNLDGNWVRTGWVETLEPVRWVVALDCRGHGQSDKPHDPDAYGAENMAQDVLRLMDHLNIDKADLFGYSMGAGIATYLLAHHRERFTSVIVGGIGNIFLLTGVEFGRIIADALLAKDPSQITNLVAKVFRAFAELDPNNDLEALAACALRLGSPSTALTWPAWTSPSSLWTEETTFCPETRRSWRRPYPVPGCSSSRTATTSPSSPTRSSRRKSWLS